MEGPLYNMFEGESSHRRLLNRYVFATAATKTVLGLGNM